MEYILIRVRFLIVRIVCFGVNRLIVKFYWTVDRRRNKNQKEVKPL